MTLRLLLHILILIALSKITACSESALPSIVHKNDTSEIFRLLFKKDFLSRNMPGFGSLQKRNIYGDTILFEFDSIFIGHLPNSINGFNFKFLTKGKICEMASFHYNDSMEFPYFFHLNDFKKIDGAYEISLQVTCVIPLYDKYGKLISSIDSSTTNKCIFGMMCGGGIGVIAYKEGDIIRIKKEGSWSD